MPERLRECRRFLAQIHRPYRKGFSAWINSGIQICGAPTQLCVPQRVGAEFVDISAMQYSCTDTFIFSQIFLPIFLIALLPKPRRSHRYVCVCGAALSEKCSAEFYQI